MKALVSAVAVMLTACCPAEEDSQIGEVIYGYHWQGPRLFAEVLSHGCTRAEDFSLHWQKEQLLLRRNKPDRCRRMPFITTLEFITTRGPEQFVTLKNPVTETR